MANLINFKLGEFATLASQSIVPGTVYITKKEKAMYVDVDSDTRIRVGQIIDYADYDSFADFINNSTPPYNEGAFYYIEAENALLRWKTDADDSRGGKWVQINSTSDLELELKTEIDAAKKAASGAQAAAEAAQTTANQAVTDAATAQKAAEAAQSTADSKVTMAEVEAKDYATKAEAQGYANAKDTAIATAQAAAEAAQSAANAAQEDVDALEDTIGTVTDGKTVVQMITDAQTAATYDDTAIKASVSKAQSTADDAVAAAGAAQTAADKAQAAADKAQNTADTNAQEIASLKSAVGDNAEGLAGKVSTLESEMDAVEAKNTEQDKTISDLSATVDANKTAAENADTAINASITSLISTVNTKASSDDLSAAKSALESSIATKASQADFDTLTATVNTKADQSALDSAKTELEDLITDEINAANAMTYKGVVATAGALPTTDVSVGDTYVASADMTVGGQAVYVGDLLIANGTETDNVIGDNLYWDVAPTGYHSTKDPSLDVDGTTVKLTNAADGSLGAVTFAVEEGSSLTVTESNGTITFGLEWGTF